MPPDRSTLSPAPHSTTGPLQAPPPPTQGTPQAAMERGKACLTCRTRKVRCDGERPCGACVKSARVKGMDASSIICSFNEGPAVKGRSSSGKVAALEQKIIDLERTVGRFAAVANPPHSPSTSAPASYASPHDLNHLLTSEGEDFTTSPSHFFVTNNEAAIRSIPSPASGSGGVPSPRPQPIPPPLPRPSQLSSIAPSAPLTHGDPILELVYPGWPADLPSPSLVNKLVDAFFQKSHALTGMVNHRKFAESLVLPPTSPGFPHSALIHAICASACIFASPEVFVGEEKYWGKHDPAEYPSDYHASRAKLAIDEAIARGEKVFQAAQAITMLCYYSYTNGRFLEVFVYTALGTRICSPLGLNHIRPKVPPGFPQIPRVGQKPTLLQDTDDQEELYERSMTMWLAFCCDRFATASTGWPTSMDETDISSLLPSPGPPTPFSAEDMLASPLCPQNPSFFMLHPPHLVQTCQLYIKAIILMGRVCDFRHRAPAPIGTKLTAAPLNYDLRSTSAFQRLDSDIEAFQLSVPREYQEVQEYANADSRMCLVFAVPRATAILLHEPFCTAVDGDPSFAKCLQAAKAIYLCIYTLWTSHFDLPALAPFINHAWLAAGRTLVRDLAIKESKGNFADSQQLREDVGLILAAMTAFKSPLGDSIAGSLRALLENPTQTLPGSDAVGSPTPPTPSGTACVGTSWNGTPVSRTQHTGFPPTQQCDRV